MPRPPVTGYAAIGLHNPINLLNIGAALRAAACFDVALVVIAGRHYSAQRTDTARAYLNTPLLQVEDLHNAIPFDCVPVAVERRDDAIPLPIYEHPDRAFYIFGPEDGDLGQSVLAWRRDVVTVPSHHSLNLAAAVNIVLYDRLAKSLRDQRPQR